MRGRHVRFRDPGRRLFGCTLAARLSEDLRNSVLLVEAGKDVTEETAHPDVLASYPGRAYFNPDFTWPGLNVLLGGAGQNDPHSRNRARYEQARILGGGSSINGLIANRGAPTDYDGWEELGATGWNWDSVLPYFRKLERDLDFDGPYHGKDGPITVRRYPMADWAGFVGTVAKVLEKRGLPIVPDQNGAWQDGAMPVPTSIDERDRRVSCAMAYLTPQVRRRKNLTIRTETYVRRILFDGARATGAEIARGDQNEIVQGRELILTCGAIHSPAVLLRTGVGAPDELARHGIGIVAPLPGVGRNLVEHPSVSISCYLDREARLADLTRHHTQMQVRFSSRLPGCPAGDMCIAVLARSGWHALGQRVSSLYFWVNKAYSQGSVTLRSADPAGSHWSISACCRTAAISNGYAPRSASWRKSRRLRNWMGCGQRSSRPIIRIACAACRGPASATPSRCRRSPRCSARCRRCAAG